MKTRLFRTALLGSIVTLALSASAAEAATFKVLYSFDSDANDGLDPQGGLIRDKAGNFFGVTVYGGVSDKGTIFSVHPDGTETKLYDFASTPDGGLPRGTLFPDKPGNFYATTTIGGAAGDGAVVKLAPDGVESVLYSFRGESDGYEPIGDLIGDKQGNLYGVTIAGGNFTCLQTGCGVIFKLAADGSETVLHAFAGTDGFYPVASVITDKAGNLYGTTSGGGANGLGVVFKLAPDGTETVLHSFAGGSDGAIPWSGLLLDKSGDLYGTTTAGGGSANCDGGCGTIFRLTPDGTEAVLHAFSGAADGSLPTESLIRGGDGDFYSVATAGGKKNLGTIFRMSPKGKFTVLHAFRGKDGSAPNGKLLMDKKGNLFGAAYYGGKEGQGVVYELKP
jgi:uncharacterized repeat protein (TIGR03803 family)